MSGIQVTTIDQQPDIRRADTNQATGSNHQRYRAVPVEPSRSMLIDMTTLPSSN